MSHDAGIPRSCQHSGMIVTRLQASINPRVFRMTLNLLGERGIMPEAEGGDPADRAPHPAWLRVSGHGTQCHLGHVTPGIISAVRIRAFFYTRYRLAYLGLMAIRSPAVKSWRIRLPS